jgi:hypothetical protein
MFIVVGGTADTPSTRIKEGTKILRKYGTSAVGHRVDLGNDFVSGDNGGMVFGRVVTTAANSHLIDTMRGAPELLFVNENTAAVSDSNFFTEFTTTGLTMGSKRKC